jgi:hypothetical protein
MRRRKENSQQQQKQERAQVLVGEGVRGSLGMHAAYGSSGTHRLKTTMLHAARMKKHQKQLDSDAC